MKPITVALVADAWALKRDPLGLGVRLARTLRTELGLPVAIVDLSGPGGLGGALRRLSIAPGDFDVGVVLLGVEDAPQDPAARTWLDGAEALADLLALRSDHGIVVAVPPPIADGVAEVGGYSTAAARRWSARIPPKLVERVSAWDQVATASVQIPAEGRADDAWPSHAGLDVAAAAITDAVLRLRT
jgi:hypothetical protein